MRIYFVDSFTNQPFKGNPAAVVLQDKALPDKLMQNIAQEIGFSETAFLLKNDKDKYLLRWFSPTTEVSLCGHATLATAKIFFTYLKPEQDSIEFQTQYGKITSYRQGNDIEMRFPRDFSTKQKYYNEIKEYLAFPIKDNILFSKENHYLTVFVADSLNLNDLAIDIERISKLSTIIPNIRGLIISNKKKDKVQMRFFDPWEGIPEDPVTGSAALVLSEYWFDYLKVNFLEIEQVSSRGGKMFVKLNDRSISIIGTATIILEGKMMVGKNGE